MNKALLITLGLMVMLTPSCNTQPVTNNANQNSNRNANSANQNTETVTYKGETFTADDLPSEITMRYDVSKIGSVIDIKETCLGCITTIPYMKKGEDAKLNWKVVFKGFPPDVKAHIKDFKDISTVPPTTPNQPDLPTPPPSANPFDASSSPPYDFSPSSMMKTVKPVKGGTYKYSVVVEWKNDIGVTQTVSMDPRVVFSDTGFTLRNTTASPSK